MDLELLKQQTPSAYPTVATAMGTYAFYALASYAADAVGSRSVTGDLDLYIIYVTMEPMEPRLLPLRRL